jgi:hypothetical protein
MGKIRRAKTVRIAGLKIADPDVVAVLRVTEHLDSLSRERVLSCAARLYQYELVGIKPPLIRFRAKNEPTQRKKCSSSLVTTIS